MASMNSLQVLYFEFLIILLYLLCFSFHSMQSIWLCVLFCRFLARFSSFLALVSSSFHHLLLKDAGFFLGVVSAVASWGDVEHGFDWQVVGVVVIFCSYLAFNHAVYCMLVSPYQVDRCFSLRECD